MNTTEEEEEKKRKKLSKYCFFFDDKMNYDVDDDLREVSREIVCGACWCQFIKMRKK